MSRILPALRVVLFSLLWAATLAIASGCGLKGDLVLPEPSGEPADDGGDGQAEDDASSAHRRRG